MLALDGCSKYGLSSPGRLESTVIIAPAPALASVSLVFTRDGCPDTLIDCYASLIRLNIACCIFATSAMSDSPRPGVCDGFAFNIANGISPIVFGSYSNSVKFSSFFVY